MGRPSVLTCCPGHASEHRESWRQSTSSRHIIPQRKICTRLAALVVPTLRRFEWKGFDFADEARACQPFCCELADFLIDNHDRGDREREDDECGPGRQQQRGASCEIVPYPQKPCVRRCACPKPRGVAGRRLALLRRVLGDDAVARMSLHSDRDDRASQSLTPWLCSCSPGPSETFATSDRVLHFQRYGRNPRNHVRSEVETSLSRTCDLRRVESDCESSMGPRMRSGKPSKPNQSSFTGPMLPDIGHKAPADSACQALPPPCRRQICGERAPLLRGDLQWADMASPSRSHLHIAELLQVSGGGRTQGVLGHRLPLFKCTKHPAACEVDEIASCTHLLRRFRRRRRLAVRIRASQVIIQIVHRPGRDARCCRDGRRGDALA